MKKTYTEQLPRKLGIGGKQVVDWKNSIGSKVPFVYDDVQGDIEILDYDGKYLSVKYLNKESFKILTSSILRCEIGTLTGKITKEFKFEIGQVFKDEKRDITIIDRKYETDKNGNKYKCYKYKCNRCGFDCGKHYHLIKKEFCEESWVSEYNIVKQGCSCCCHNPQVVVIGINDIRTTAPSIARLFVNKEDIFKNTFGTGNKVLLKCPNCGNEKYVNISNLTVLNRAFPCNKCSDNISIPEKFIFSLLKVLNNKNNMYFKTQLTRYDFSWASKFKYDFYFKYDNEQYIIETHGRQHYEDTNIGKGKGRSFEEEQKNDILKKNLALTNGIKEDNYIVIDCRFSELEFIKNNILNSKLSDLFDLSIVDWKRLFCDIQSSLMLKSCEIKKENPDYTVSKISNILNIGSQSVRAYLKRGNILGLCYYDGKEEMHKYYSKKVVMYKDNILLYEFGSAIEIERKSKDLFGIDLKAQGIRKCCNFKIDNYYGYSFKFA